MEAFEKWLKENPYSKSIAPEVANLAWRDALEWAKEEMISLYTEQTGEVLSLDEFFKLMKKRIEAELES